MKSLMKTIGVLLASMAAAAALSETEKQPQPPQAVRPRPMDAAAISNMLAQTGGPIKTPVTGPAVGIINIQKRISAAALSEFSENIIKFAHIPATVREQRGKDAMRVATDMLKEKNTAAVIVVCDNAEYPPMLVAPEARWAVVNVKALDTGGIDADALTLRFQKELWRAFAHLMGAATSDNDICLLKPVFSPADLDELKPRMISPEPLGKISRYATKLGIKPIRTTTYRKACEEGWALAPTNGFQKAIWDEVKAKKAE